MADDIAGLKRGSLYDDLGLGGRNGRRGSVRHRQVRRVRSEARWSHEQCRARVAGGAQPIQAVRIPAGDGDRDGLRRSCREVERNASSEVAGAKNKDVCANVGHGPDVRPAGAMVDSAMRTIHSDVAIIGGGLVGTWTAYFLRKRGHAVSVIEKGAVGSQASGVNFGNVRLEGRHPTELPLALRAIEQWEHIEELIGERCEFAPC